MKIVFLNVTICNYDNVVAAAVMRVRMKFYTDPDPGSGNSPYGSKSGIENSPYGSKEKVKFFFPLKIKVKKNSFKL